ncbi:putative alkaline shock family protein YloU [Bacillus capparidis]|uniref:Alkaline shock family protein YloU n=1 Tax=Bacillus capparidis TaxID=1840411 RepID=A0ABS4CYB1_9BACI|nr:hypothetical protein [Bacillus capparidis]MBP1082349.1 putative alkaline shock family protein YloU [Bacillus capparidis]
MIRAIKTLISQSLCPTTRAYLERVIVHLTGIQAPQKRKEKEKKQQHKDQLIKQEAERQLCLFELS